MLVIGLFGLMLIYSNALTTVIQQNIEIQVFLDKHITDNEQIKLTKTISSRDYVLSINGEPQVSLLTKEEGAKQFIQETGEDFIEFIGDNPLRDVITIKISPDYQNPEKMMEIRQELESTRGIYEVSYVENLVASINSNLAKISLVLAAIAILLIVIAVVLINNTIKLALFSQRFLIRSMQLVGATSSFIKGPFLKRSMLYGLLAGIISAVMLFIFIQYAGTRIEELALLQTENQNYVLMGSLILIGIVVGYFSTYRAINKYLKCPLMNCINMSKENRLPFGKMNYTIMIIGLVVLVLGFIIMTLDSEPYGFGFMGLTLGPMIVVVGFAIEFVAILYKPKTDK